MTCYSGLKIFEINFPLKFVKGNSRGQRLNFSTNKLKRPKRRQQRPFEGPSYRTLCPRNKPSLGRATETMIVDMLIQPNMASKRKEIRPQKEDNTASKHQALDRNQVSSKETLVTTTKVGLFFPGLNMINLKDNTRCSPWAKNSQEDRARLKMSLLRGSQTNITSQN